MLSSPANIWRLTGCTAGASPAVWVQSVVLGGPVPHPCCKNIAMEQQSALPPAFMAVGQGIHSNATVQTKSC